MSRVVLFDNNGQIIQTLEIEDPPSEPDYQGFYNGLLSSMTYQALLQTPATAEQAKALAIFVSAIQDAMAGRVNPAAMQGAIWLLLGQVELTAAHVAELSELMAVYHLSTIYSLAPS
jgi:hypothetical protein